MKDISGWVYNKYTLNKVPLCVDIIRCTSLGFLAGALKPLILRTRASRAPTVKTSKCTADYINTLGWFCVYIYPDLNHCRYTSQNYLIVSLYFVSNKSDYSVLAKKV